MKQLRAMCTNPTCPMRESCARHAACATPEQPQAYLIEQRYGSQGCDYFLPTEPEARAA